MKESEPVPIIVKGEVVNLANQNLNKEADITDLAAWGSLVLALLSLCAACACFSLYGIVNVPIAITALIAYYFGRKSSQYKIIAQAGAIIAIVVIILTILFDMFAVAVVGISLLSPRH